MLKRMTVALVALLVGVVVGGAVVFGVTQTAVPNLEMFLGTSDIVAADLTITDWSITLDGTDVTEVTVTVANSDGSVHDADVTVTLTDGTGNHVGVWSFAVPASGNAQQLIPLATPASLITLSGVNFLIEQDI